MNLARIVKNIFFLLVAIFAGLTLIVVTLGVKSASGELTPINLAVESALTHFRTPLMTTIMLLITNIGSPLILSTLAILLAILLILHRDTYDTLLYIVALGISVGAFMIMKNSLGLERPVQSLIANLSGWSYPSGHATVATAFFFITGYSFFHWPKNWATKISIATFCIIAAGLVAFSRVYLGAHFALDVLGGIALGLLTVSGTIILFNVFLSEREWWRRRVRSL